MTWLNLDDPASTLAIVAPAANSGKSTIAIGLGRLLSNAGRVVLPFKAVTVAAAGADFAFVGLPSWQWGILHNCRAARRSVNHWNNPVSVIQESPGDLAGTVLIWGQPEGEVALAGDDLLDPRVLGRRVRRLCEDAICEATLFLTRQDGWLLVEGAGALGDLPPSHDLANWTPHRTDRYPAVVSVSVRKSGHVSGAVGALSLLQQDPRRTALGFIINQADGPCGSRCPCLLISKLTGANCLGHVPDTPRLDDYDASESQLEWLYDRAAEAVMQANPFDDCGSANRAAALTG